LLVAALLFGQFGGLAHGLSHHQPDQGEPHPACQLCGAYASFDHALSGATPDLPVVAVSESAAPIPPRSRPSLFQPPFRSRAPPLVA
jgi:hypothetical protein